MNSVKTGSRIPSFYQLSVTDRVQTLHERGFITAADLQALNNGDYLLRPKVADKMIENVIGIMGLPIGVALNFLINGRDWIIPMVVEEPSIVAGLSSAAKTARLTGGFKAECTESVLIGQVQVAAIPDVEQAYVSLQQSKQRIVDLANKINPRMVARGGGIQTVEVRRLDTESGLMLILHLLVDTQDAMGANMVNTLCEGVAPLVEEITGGTVFLRILSNLTDRSIVRAQMVMSLEALAGKGFTGEQVRDGIIIASHFAAADPYRAATHNKGIMNGIDAVAIATGNDWRAIEAAAHAYAARSGQYTSLSQFSATADGDLLGKIEIPVKVGIVGANLGANPMVAFSLRVLQAETAAQLATVMGCVGLAQNFAALKVLATEGIQQGHMSLHARSVATTAGASPELFDQVTARLVECGEIKVWKAQEIIAKLQAVAPSHNSKVAANYTKPLIDEAVGQGNGKVILLGEHSVVYGRRVLAAPIPLAISANVRLAATDGVKISIPEWGIHEVLVSEAKSWQRPIGLILQQLELANQNLRLMITPHIPRAMGLGSSAALAVAIIRALDKQFKLRMSDQEVNALAYQSEQLAHGSASGIDNTIATYGQFIAFQKNEETFEISPIQPIQPLAIVIAQTGVEGSTVAAVHRVQQAWQNSPQRYNTIFDAMDELAGEAIQAAKSHQLANLGELMNLCQGYLNALQVSGPEIETVIQIARQAGALGAKLTGGGLGGSVVALCEQDTGLVAQAIRTAGYKALEFSLE